MIVLTTFVASGELLSESPNPTRIKAIGPKGTEVFEKALLN